MIKIENLSNKDVILKFDTFTKILKPNSLLNLSPEEFEKINLPSDIQHLKITKYNVVGGIKGKVEVLNPTNDKIILKFVRNIKDTYYKSLMAKSSILLKTEEFNLIKDIDTRLIINQTENNKVYFSIKKTKEDRIIEENEKIEEVNFQTQDATIIPLFLLEKEIPSIKDKLIKDVKSYKKTKN